ncbi:phycobiliprotein lyase [Gloeocapsa sp. PCC 73106]|uniref:phycobiliprotein lyase n=1 Tax=Gloeocapsa sp. PCC 73106 TaxID=102232 RepID=UPI000554EB21|nr:phycobiliprotein lyase [Gloeocapsa sp. PCC 73106]
MTSQEFANFFSCCVGNWVTERTYHYLTNSMVERSRTEFQIKPLSDPAKIQVLTDNMYSFSEATRDLQGFNLEFYTISETGVEVTQNLNILFIINQEHDKILMGDYLRDRAYEEAKPIVSQFSFDLNTKELLMKTNYTQIVSVDSITLINPNLRLRKIVNYQRPKAEEALDKVFLVGFGVEEKVN